MALNPEKVLLDLRCFGLLPIDQYGDPIRRGFDRLMRLHSLGLVVEGAVFTLADNYPEQMGKRKRSYAVPDILTVLQDQSFRP